MVKASDFETVADGLTFPEGPRWHDGKFWFSDFYTYSVYTLDADNKLEAVAEVPNQPSGLGWAPNGDLLIVSMLDHKLLRQSNGTITEVADMSAYAKVASNDMVVDKVGRAYVGNFGVELPIMDNPGSTNLVRVDPDSSVSVAADDMWFPNGTVITDDGKTLIIGESFANRLTAFDVAEDGSLSNRRVWAELGEDGFPDGMCLDAEGGIWVCGPRLNRLSRVFEGGKTDVVVDFGEVKPVACMLGGNDRKTLYLLTNTHVGLASAEAKGGKVETLRVDVPGAGLP